MEKLKQDKVSKSESESEPIPCDLLIDIFSRVPANSIARSCCVSKLWASVPGLTGFTELFLTKSVSRPRILFAIEVDKELVFFSSPQPHNPLHNSTLVATRYKSFPKYFPSRISPPLCGSVFLHDARGRNKLVIYNPVTGESITLPRVKATGNKRSFFGYDPINKQFKVVCTTWSNGEPNTYHVLTLGSTGKRLWRSFEWNHCYKRSDERDINGEICINGVVYCGAYYTTEGSCMIGCFDFSSEKFSFINFDEEVRGGTLVNYKGKLGVLLVKHGHVLLLWVLKGAAGEHKWSLSIHELSVVRFSKRIENNFHIVGVTGAGEIVFSEYCQSNPFYIVYYNIERNTFTTVNIQGFEQFQHGENIQVNTFLDYVENMKIL